MSALLAAVLRDLLAREAFRRNTTKESHDRPSAPDLAVAGARQVTQFGGLPTTTEVERILDAALAELAAKRIGAFTLDGVAARMGVSSQAIQQIWPNTPDLLSAALRAFAERNIPIPDTGTLRGDLLGFARSYAQTVNTPVGRRVLDAVIVKPGDWELDGSRAVFLDDRVSRFTPVFERAVARGECHGELDPALTIDLLGIGLCLPVLYYDKPVTDEHCVYVVDTLLHGIVGKR